MPLLGLLSGTMPLFDLGLFDHLEMQTRDYPSGIVTFHLGHDLILLSRHGQGEKGFTPPHLINHLAHMQTLAEWGVTEIVGVYSTGSLKENLKPGMLTVPDDFICLYPTPSSVNDAPHHITPVIDSGVRRRLLNASGKLGIDVQDGGVYWQTAGPRLETKAEIRMMAGIADVVGMTMASEAILAREFGIAFGAVCSVDNYAHGIASGELKEGDIRAQAKCNAENIGRIISCYIEDYRFRMRPIDRA